jgi:periplasmic divalent cation tolerance protein
MTDRAAFVYTTVATDEEAQRLGRLLLEQRLVACVNRLPQMMSQYWWQGEIVEAGECGFWAKTTPELAAQAADAIRAHHSYDVPAVFAFYGQNLNPDFAAWMGGQLAHPLV